MEGPLHNYWREKELFTRALLTLLSHLPIGVLLRNREFASQRVAEQGSLASLPYPRGSPGG
jgi:hypothetical protein